MEDDPQEVVSRTMNDQIEVIDLTIDEPGPLNSTIKTEPASVHPIVPSPVPSPVPSTPSGTFTPKLRSTSIPTPPSTSLCAKTERELSHSIKATTPYPSSPPTPSPIPDASYVLPVPQAASLSLESHPLYNINDKTYWDIVNARFIKLGVDIPAPVTREKHERAKRNPNSRKTPVQAQAHEQCIQNLALSVAQVYLILKGEFDLNEFFLHFPALWFDETYTDKTFRRSAFQRRILQGLASTLRAIIVQRGIKLIKKLQSRDLLQSQAEDDEESAAQFGD
ncbi:hypothetical protein BTUL_0190g00120 [Botrytis tulipae]|uniref:Uncharacterized protein n=1 Tax=Botrytis tulipae TaxID=87230 RepID=A0A4Z1EEL2_9HELO|nr:hypothetical protein BTUL_0190g00120 [Botrytis tulipae]